MTSTTIACKDQALGRWRTQMASGNFLAKAAEGSLILEGLWHSIGVRVIASKPTGGHRDVLLAGISVSSNEAMARLWRDVRSIYSNRCEKATAGGAARTAKVACRMKEGVQQWEG